MAVESKTEIVNYSVSAETGHIMLHLRSHSKDGNHEWYGPVAGYGCDPKMLQLRFGGSLDAFEAWAVKEHQPFVGAHPGLAEEVQKRKGKVL
jgi:hypothetical protein